MTDRTASDDVALDSHQSSDATGLRGHVTAAALVIVSCLAIQGSAAIATTLFSDMTPPGVAAWRQLVGAITLAIIVRPRFRGRGHRRWMLTVLLGIAIAAMNTTYYLAVERLPLGIAASLIYLGPFIVAVATIRRVRLLAWPLLALVGVLAITRPDQGSPESTIGFTLGLLAAAALAAYTVLSHRLGENAGLDDLALAICFSALTLSPVAAHEGVPTAPELLATVALLGALGVALPFTCDYQALKLSGPTLVSTLFALDPSVGAVIGLVLLGEALGLSVVLGLIAICIAGVGLTLATARPTLSMAPPARILIDRQRMRR